MKTQILQLEPHDDVISTRDKMGWGQVARIVLVWPKNERILVRKLDLLLLNRQAIKMGAQLALVTDDPDVRYNARQLGIPVFKNQRLARNPRWRAGKKPSRTIERRRPRPDLTALRQEVYPSETAWYNHPNARRSFHAVSILAVLILLSLVIPSATITLKPKTAIQSMRIPVSASSSVQEIKLSGEVPAYETSFQIEGSDQIGTTGTMKIPEKSSFGRVEFTNLTDKVIHIPTGLVVTTLPENEGDAIRFSTTVAVDVAAGGTALISIRCLTAGNVGNVQAGEIKGIEGPLGLQLAVTNPAPTIGGAEQEVPAPTLEDYKKLYDRLYTQLEKDARRQLGEGDLGIESIPIMPSLSLVSIIEETYDPPIQEGGFSAPAEKLSLKMRLEFRGLFVSDKDLKDMATRILDTNLPDGYTPLNPILNLEHLSEPLLNEDSNARWRIEATRTLKAVIEEQQVQELVRGLPPTQAAFILHEDLPIEGDASIQLAPQWWPLLPALPFRIGVSIP